MTTVLTITTLMGNVERKLPHTSYPKVPPPARLQGVILCDQAIGIYLWVCFIFTFAALVEYSMAAYLEKRKTILAGTRRNTCTDLEADL